MFKKHINETNDLLFGIIMSEMIEYRFQLAAQLNMISTDVEWGSTPESALLTIEEVLEKEETIYSALRSSYQESLDQLASMEGFHSTPIDSYSYDFHFTEKDYPMDCPTRFDENYDAGNGRPKRK
jgi:hypothetical protein